MNQPNATPAPRAAAAAGKKKAGASRKPGKKGLSPSALSPGSTRSTTREEHSQETAQDYVELIADLIEKRGEARVSDMARHLGVTHVTVSRTVQRLKREGLVTSQPYRSIFLTESGSALAKESRERHETVVRFLVSLGIPPEVAESDAEGIEHHVSQETLAAFVKHLRKSE